MPKPDPIREFDEEQEKVAVSSDLRDSLNRALRDLERIKKSKAELVDAVYRAALDGARALQLKPVPAPKPDKRQGSEEVAIAVLSDFQLAKKTPTYNSSVCEQRIEEYAERVVKLAQIQRADHPVREVRVYMLGDLVEGELIFPGQQHLIDASLYRQVVVDGPRILGNFMRKMLANFERVHVVGVIGNHGALGGATRREHHPETNADAMLYEVVRQIIQGPDEKKPREPRLTWAPNAKWGERNWHAVDTIGTKSFLLFHGDQIKGGFAGLPWYGFSKKVMGWAMGAVHEPFDYALAGHYHTPTRMLIGRKRLWVNGTTESDNTYAAERLAAQGTPSQWLLFCHPIHGVTAEYEVHLGRDEQGA